MVYIFNKNTFHFNNVTEINLGRQSLSDNEKSAISSVQSKESFYTFKRSAW